MNKDKTTRGISQDRSKVAGGQEFKRLGVYSEVTRRAFLK